MSEIDFLKKMIELAESEMYMATQTTEEYYSGAAGTAETFLEEFKARLEVLETLSKKTYVLIHNNVDGYPSNWGKYETYPTLQELTNTLLPYYDEKKAIEIAGDIHSNGEVSVNDSSATTFELMEV